ncbi:MAG: glycerophosphodiester phosphodiesterase [Myxococcales bacterium]|nr:glycerophosphodiester phosphodiesterase [Myxococcales bacterium]MCB9576541.1 glycerophosphodiester phosphodiesterase [Polyangiaceae bacterium]
MLGHRGARRRAPENTLAAFELSRKEGADGVELDVRLDAAHAVVVFHDATLERMTEGRDARSVERLSATERARVELVGERIPTLADVLDWARRHDQRVNVELKRDVRERRVFVNAVARLLQREPPERIVLSSFDPMLVRALAQRLPALPVAWLVHAKQRVLRFAPGYRLLGAVGVHPEAPLATPKRVARLHRAGAFVNVWTVNEGARAQKLAAAGVDAIITDVPAEILQALSTG